MKKYISILLLMATLLVACGGTAEPTVGENPVTGPAPTEPEIILTLKDLGGTQTIGAVTLTNMGPVNGNPTFSRDGILTDHLNEKIKLLDMNGNPQLARDYDGVAMAIGNGICVVSENVSYGIDLYGIVNIETGEEIVPCEAVEVVPLSDRYILMNYVEELTTGRNYYGYFLRNGQKVYYKGYGKVLDLEEKRFVPELQLTNGKRQISVLDSLLLLESDAYSVKDVYDSDGNMLGSYVHLYAVGHSGIALQVLPDSVRVLNSKLETVSTLPGKIYDFGTIPGADDMLIKNEIVEKEPVAYIVDLNGEKLSESFSAICAVFESRYICHSIQQEETNAILYGVSDFEGNVLVPAEYDNIQYIAPGYFLCQTAEGYYMYDLQGNACNQEPLDYHRNSPMLYQGGHEKMLILQTGEIYESQQYAEYKCLSLVLADGKLIDLITGETVLEDVDSCISMGNNLYVWDNETTIYTRYTAQYAKDN